MKYTLLNDRRRSLNWSQDDVFAPFLRTRTFVNTDAAIIEELFGFIRFFRWRCVSPLLPSHPAASPSLVYTSILSSFPVDGVPPALNPAPTFLFINSSDNPKPVIYRRECLQPHIPRGSTSEILWVLGDAFTTPPPSFLAPLFSHVFFSVFFFLFQLFLRTVAAHNFSTQWMHRERQSILKIFIVENNKLATL